MGREAFSEIRLAEVLDEALARYDEPTGQVLGVLGCMQDAFGYVPEEGLGLASERLGVPRARLEAVCEFFRGFATAPLGRHVLVVCDGTACHAAGAPELVQLLEKTLGISVGQTTPDGEFSLLTTRCVGSCGLAPILQIDDRAVARVGLSDVAQMVKREKR